MDVPVFMQAGKDAHFTADVQPVARLQGVFLVVYLEYRPLCVFVTSSSPKEDAGIPEEEQQPSSDSSPACRHTKAPTNSPAGLQKNTCHCCLSATLHSLIGEGEACVGLPVSCLASCRKKHTALQRASSLCPATKLSDCLVNAQTDQTS
jgi:hypothetical protein